jgi:two-component system OmpR family sensor kinase
MNRVADPTQIAMNRATTRLLVGRWIAHDLRGPVQAIALVGDLLVAGDHSAAEGMQDTLRDNTRRMRQLLDLLVGAFDHPVAAEPQPVALATVVDGVMAICRTHRGIVTISVDRERIGGLPAAAGRADDVLQILLNLVLNALTAQHAQATGAIRIAGAVVAEGSGIELTVEDDGPGLPPNVAAAFAEAPDPTVVTDGLGLLVARTLAQRAGGALSARGASAGTGTRCILTLPAWRRVGA